MSSSKTGYLSRDPWRATDEMPTPSEKFDEVINGRDKKQETKVEVPVVTIKGDWDQWILKKLKKLFGKKEE